LDKFFLFSSDVQNISHFAMFYQIWSPAWPWEWQSQKLHIILQSILR